MERGMDGGMDRRVERGMHGQITTALRSQPEYRLGPGPAPLSALIIRWDEGTSTRAERYLTVVFTANDTNVCPWGAGSVRFPRALQLNTPAITNDAFLWGAVKGTRAAATSRPALLAGWEWE